MKVHQSARKHGISAEDSVHAASRAVYVAELDDENPARQFRLGFDSTGRLLELVVLRFDGGRELVIHSMKARAKYAELLE
ncbi:toxin [Zhihengliuella halotolerans]|uniref:toxin n=1 Tax=Zhihengliuella halotolerans TaxID=370736 RepID=UPI000C7F88FC|nr:toxin [Zhihengliuella halotolerans]